jgi:hypothetical protein
LAQGNEDAAPAQGAAFVLEFAADIPALRFAACCADYVFVMTKL